MKVLNLYCGIGGNRKLWGDDHEITAVENNKEVAAIYKEFFPNDNVIVGDAHQYLWEHYKEFEFIWSSPPCPTHSRMRFLHHHKPQSRPTPYPDMTLWQEIIFLKTWFNGSWVVENVRLYYKPLIEHQESENHYFWSNLEIPKFKAVKRKIRRDGKKKKWGFDLTNVNIKSDLRRQILNNLVRPELALHIFNSYKGGANKMEFKDLAVEGAAIAAKPQTERFADIISPEPRYEPIPSLEDGDNPKEKLIVNVRISGKDCAEYYPNKTSSRFIANTLGTDMKKWIGCRIYWNILDQKVAGQDKKVLYVNKVTKI